MRDAFSVTPLGDVVDVIGGGTPSKRNAAFYGGEIPWATVRDMNCDLLDKTEHKITKAGLDGSSSKVIPAGEVVIATRVGLGKVCILEQDTAINQDLRGLIPKADKKVDRRYLFYWLKSIARVIIGAGTGATVQGVKLQFVKSLPFPFPSLEEQQRIVEVLDEAFEGLARARAHAEANLRNARELFESAMVRVLSSNKVEWSEQTLGEICEFITDGTHQTPKYFNEGYTFLSSKNVKEGVIDWDDIKYIDREQHEKMHRRLAPRLGDILLRKNGAGYGKAAVVDREAVFDVYVSLAVLRPKQHVSPRYLLHYVNSPVAMRQFKDRIKGQGVPNLHLQEIREVGVRLPQSRAEQDELASFFERMFLRTKELTNRYKDKIADLDDLRQSLLQKAFSGELS